MWATLIASILAVLGPQLAAWLEAWLEGLFKESAKSLGKMPKDKAKAHDLLLDEAISRAPYFAFGRKRLLKKIRAAGPEPDKAMLASLRSAVADAGAE